MKKILLVVLMLAMTLCAFTACGGKKEDINKKSAGVMTHAEYVAAEDDATVVIEAYVQAKQGWWEKNGQGVASIYAQDGVGGYFIYELPCTEAQYNQMKTGTKIQVTGSRATWAGEIEIMNVTDFKILSGKYVAKPTDVTALLGTDDLAKKMNMLVSFKGMTVAASTNADGEDVAFLYNWDGSGQKGSDLYFNVMIGGETYNFCVESYLCDQNTDVYKAVEALEIGDVIDLEGFLYWYDGANPHITSVKAAD